MWKIWETMTTAAYRNSSFQNPSLSRIWSLEKHLHVQINVKTTHMSMIKTQNSQIDQLELIKEPILEEKKQLTMNTQNAYGQSNTGDWICRNFRLMMRMIWKNIRALIVGINRKMPIMSDIIFWSLYSENTCQNPYRWKTIQVPVCQKSFAIHCQLKRHMRTIVVENYSSARLARNHFLKVAIWKSTREPIPLKSTHVSFM